MNSPVWYPIAVCTAGGVVIGVFRKYFGDYPQTMKTVIGTVKKTGSYPYHKIVVILIAAALPLIFGSSIGPEAGMVGVLVALGCWVNEKIKFAKENAALYSKVGMAVSLSVLFYSPLFGFFSAVENEDTPFTDSSEDLDRNSELLIYGVSIVSSLGILTLLNQLLVFFLFAFIIYRHETVFQTYGSTLWYCFELVTTIGFGELVAVTKIGKFLRQ